MTDYDKNNFPAIWMSVWCFSLLREGAEIFNVRVIQTDGQTTISCAQDQSTL